MTLTCDLVIPAYNEAENIDALFHALGPLRRRDVVRRVIVTDNASTDATAERAREHGAVVVYEPQRGYGAACLKALAWVDSSTVPPPDVIAFLDADLADDPAQLPRLLEPLERGDADIVIGSRRALAEPGSLNAPQRMGNALACHMIAVLAGRKFSDLGPFRAVRYPTLQLLQMADRTWGWTVEMQMKAALLDLPVVEVDGPYRRRHSGRSKISGTLRGVVAAGTRIISTILLLWLRRRQVLAAANAAAETRSTATAATSTSARA